ncbi:MAG: YiiD C-terminal domain-containing protein [Firmicutes bacterium]|nr:YiiD C-terminal domain-containing protein [Bacillota bacterium]
MSPRELEHYLHQHIPISKAMHVRVLACDNRSVVLSAPLEPNINHRETAFGGSASALAILSAWSLVHVRLTEAGIASRIVIQRNTMEYRRPIKGEFTARASLKGDEEWAKFVQAFVRRGKARIRVDSVVEYAQEIAGEFSGDFVALGPG